MYSSSPPISHAQDLDHSDEDVEEVKLKADTLVDDILSHKAGLSKSGVVKDLLDIVECEATENCKTSIQPDVLTPHQTSCSSGG